MTPEIIETVENTYKILRGSLFNNELIVVEPIPDNLYKIVNGFRINPQAIGQVLQVPEEELVDLEKAKMLLSITQGSVNRFIENLEKDNDGSELRETSTSEFNREEDKTT